MGGVGAVACKHFLVGGTYVCSGGWSWISSLECSEGPSGEFWGAYGLGKALGRSSFNVQGCGPVLLEN